MRFEPHEAAPSPNQNNNKNKQMSESVGEDIDSVCEFSDELIKSSLENELYLCLDLLTLRFSQRKPHIFF